MNNIEFENIFDRRVAMCREVMVTKAKEYAAAHDRLANFKKAGALQHEHPAKALQGMMAKHQVSIADMTAGLNAGTTYSQAQWDEKIGDALNYLFLLDAVVQEAMEAPSRMSQADLDLLEARLKEKTPLAPIGDALLRSKPAPLSAEETNKAWTDRFQNEPSSFCGHALRDATVGGRAVGGNSLLPVDLEDEGTPL